MLKGVENKFMTPISYAPLRRSLSPYKADMCTQIYGDCSKWLMDGLFAHWKSSLGAHFSVYYNVQCRKRLVLVNHCGIKFYGAVSLVDIDIVYMPFRTFTLRQHVQANQFLGVFRLASWCNFRLSIPFYVEINRAPAYSTFSAIAHFLWRVYFIEILSLRPWYPTCSHSRQLRATLYIPLQQF
jgi:hypothetical protein